MNYYLLFCRDDVERLFCYQDHPNHNVVMLAGLWDFKSSHNRNLANYIFELLTEPGMKKWYEKYRNLKQSDQIFLKEYLWEIVRMNVTIHDSFYCDQLGDAFGRTIPFPQKRPETFYCHLGGYGKIFNFKFIRLYCIGIFEYEASI